MYISAELHMLHNYESLANELLSIGLLVTLLIPLQPEMLDMVLGGSEELPDGPSHLMA